MNSSDNYLEINDRQSEGLYQSLFKQISTDKWSKAETQQDIEESKEEAFCLKTKDLNTKQKLFINFCHSVQMKAPTLDLSEEELRALLASEEATSYTIPMILTQFKPTYDKSGSKALVLDVIINSDFYRNKISFSQLFKTFLITVTLETVEEKYKYSIEKNDWILLKNKKYQEFSAQIDSSIDSMDSIGVNRDKSCDKTIVNDLNAFLNINDINNDCEDSHRFGADYEYIKTNKFKQNINNNINGDNNGSETESLISPVDRQNTETILNDRHKPEGVECVDEIEVQSSEVTPKLTLDVKNNCLNGQIVLPLISHSNQIDLRIGEDRIVLMACDYQFDIFVPTVIKANRVSATFDTFSHVLQIKMPLC